MGLFRRGWIVLAGVVLVAIFIYILWISAEYVNPVNLIGIVLVAGIMVYFIVLARGQKKS